MKTKPMKNMIDYPAQLELEQLFIYVEIDGIGFLKRRVTRGSHLAGSIAGSITIDRNGYRSCRVQMNAKEYKVSRLIYIMVIGSIPNGMIIHHIDGDSLNNSIVNLQPMTMSESMIKHEEGL